MVGDHDMDSIEREVQLIRELSGTSDFRLIAVKVNNWNDDLSPWPNSAVFGNEGFGSRISFLKICIFDIKREYEVKKTIVFSFCYLPEKFRIFVFYFFH